MVKHLQNNFENQDVELKQVFTLFSTELVASIGFGFEANVFSDPNSPFKDYVSRKYPVIKALPSFIMLKIAG